MSASTPVAGESGSSEQDDKAAPAERLLATCWSSAGDAASDRADLRSPLNLRERIEAASPTEGLVPSPNTRPDWNLREWG